MINHLPDPREISRIAAYTANDALYNGDEVAHLTATSNPKVDEVRAVFNYAKDLVNKHRDATLAGQRSVIKREVGDTSPDIYEAQRVLDDALERSGGDATLMRLLSSAIVRGDGAYYVGHTNGEVFCAELHPGLVDVNSRDLAGRPTEITAIIGDQIETWTAETVTIGKTVYANPYGIIPVIPFAIWPRAGSYWGDSLVEQIRACQRLLNERANLWMWLMRLQGNPPIKSLGTTGAKLRTAPGEVWESDSVDAKIELIKLLDAETAGIHYDTIKLLMTIMRELSNTPDVAYGIANAQLSGVALKMAYMPMLQAAATRRKLLAPAIMARDRAILVMHNVLHGKRNVYVRTNVLFDSVLPDDEVQTRTLDRYDVQVGTLSRHSYAAKYHTGLPDEDLARVYAETRSLVEAGANAPTQS